MTLNKTPYAYPEYLFDYVSTRSTKIFTFIHSHFKTNFKVLISLKILNFLDENFKNLETHKLYLCKKFISLSLSPHTLHHSSTKILSFPFLLQKYSHRYNFTRPYTFCRLAAVPLVTIMLFLCHEYIWFQIVF